MEPASQAKRRRRRGYFARLDPHKGVDRALLVLGIEEDRVGALPTVCLKCGAHKDIMIRPTDFRWIPRWARLAVFCFVGLVLILLLRRDAHVDVPLCPRCNARWRTGRIAFVSSVVALVAATVAIRLTSQPQAWLPALGILVVAFVVLLLMFVRPRLLQVHLIDDDHVYLRGFHVGAAQEIVEGSRKPKGASRVELAADDET